MSNSVDDVKPRKGRPPQQKALATALSKPAIAVSTSVQRVNSRKGAPKKVQATTSARRSTQQLRQRQVARTPTRSSADQITLTNTISNEPFGDPKFIANILPWICDIDTTRFRHAVQGKCVFISITEIETLLRLEKYEGKEAHNSHIISLIRPGGTFAYKLLCNAIHDLGPLYNEKYQEMLLLLPVDQRPTTKTSSHGTVDVATMRAGSNTANDGTVTCNILLVNDDGADNGGHIQRLKQHLHRVNTHLCKTTADHSDLTCLSGDVKDCFVPMQALTEKDALQLTYRAQQAATRRVTGRQPISDRTPGVAIPGARQDTSDKVEGGRQFVLSSAKQLLSDPHYYEGVTSGGKSGVGVGGGDDTVDEDILESCIVIGNAGQGKTTLSKRVIADIMETTTGNLAKIEFIFYVPCRDLTRIQSTDWCVFLGLDQLRISTQDQSSLLNYLSEHSDQVLIVIDGIDELGSGGFGKGSAAQAVILRSSSSNHSLLPAAIVVATSRPCAEAYQHIPHFRLRFRLLGFSADQLYAYCSRQLGEEVAKKCMEELSQRNNCLLKEGIRQSPLLCALLIQQYPINNSLPSSVTLFYDHYLRSSVAKLEKRRGKFGQVRLAHDVISHCSGGRHFSCGDLVSIPVVIEHHLERYVKETSNNDEECDHHAVELVKALHNLDTMCLATYQRGMATFTSTLSTLHQSICQDLGLLLNPGMHPSAVSSTQTVSLTHLTLQEWCASRCIISSDSCVDIIRSCINTVGTDLNTLVFWQFVFGALKPDLLHSSLLALKSENSISDYSFKSKKKMLLFLMRCLMESHISLQHNRTGNPNQDVDAIIHRCYAMSANLLASDGIDVSGIHLEVVDVMALHTVLELVDNVKSLDLGHCNLSGDSVILLSDQLDKCVKVDLRGANLTAAPLASISSTLSRSTRRTLQVLDISNTELTSGSADGAALAGCVKHPSLTYLNAHHTVLGNDGLAAFASNLAPCNNLTDLALGSCSLDSGCGSDLATLVTQLPHLYSLWLDTNSLCNSDVSCVLSSLHSHDTIQHLFFNNNRLTDELAASVVDFLQARRSREHTGSVSTTLPPCVVYLSGSGVTIRLLQEVATSSQCGGDVIDIGSRYATGTSVRTESIDHLVSVHGGGLQGKVDDSMMSSLGQYLATNTDLDQLDIATCNITDAGATALATSGLADNTVLKCLRLLRNRIQLSGVVSILQAVTSPQSHVSALGLEDNPVFHDIQPSHADCRLLCQLLSGFHQLRFISFSHTAMSDEVGASILHSLHHHARIEWMDMANNEIDDATVHALVDMMKKNTSLRLISLNNCKITDDSIQAMLQSPGIMRMEGVHLYGNPCSMDKLRPPLYNSRLWYSNSTVLEFISD
ncbi:uncharacterized protein LOC135818584 isoform X2 [Sycon ciliatum]|uniref:uncharacterized protein LOC135818584 isoform X2 n=1 Tax=Sycon ciliatum TaxID=27933 RepID=UPI0031F60A76